MPRILPSDVVKIIEKLFPQTTSQEDRADKRFSLDSNHHTQLAAILNLIDQIPEELITISEKDYLDLQVNLSVIRAAVNSWQAGGKKAFDFIRGYGTNLNPITIILKSLSKCPDQGIAESTPGLEFITDDDLKKDLQIDMAASEQALGNGEWKSATVLSGATVEAMLLYVLEEIQKEDQSKIKNAIENLKEKGVFRNSPKPNLTNWNFWELIEVSNIIGLITVDTAKQAQLAKDFRNLIHAGRSKRKGQKCDRGTAHSAFAALVLVEGDLKVFSVNC